MAEGEFISVFSNVNSHFSQILAALGPRTKQDKARLRRGSSSNSWIMIFRILSWSAWRLLPALLIEFGALWCFQTYVQAINLWCRHVYVCACVFVCYSHQLSFSSLNEDLIMRQGNERVCNESRMLQTERRTFVWRREPFPTWWYSAHTLYSRRHVSPANIKVCLWSISGYH